MHCKESLGGVARRDACSAIHCARVSSWKALIIARRSVHLYAGDLFRIVRVILFNHRIHLLLISKEPVSSPMIAVRSHRLASCCTSHTSYVHRHCGTPLMLQGTIHRGVCALLAVCAPQASAQVCGHVVHRLRGPIRAPAAGHRRWACRQQQPQGQCAGTRRGGAVVRS